MLPSCACCLAHAYALHHDTNPRCRHQNLISGSSYASQTWQTPKEIVWLNGAPGSGKGANTPFILESRGLNRAVTMSSLLERHEGCQTLMQAGELVPDAMVSILSGHGKQSGLQGLGLKSEGEALGGLAE